MALDQRLMPSNSSVAALRSTASTPSLRSSREGSMGRAGGDVAGGGGNVKVVVRVRGFLPRGMFLSSWLKELNVLTMWESRNQRRGRMSDRDESY